MVLQVGAVRHRLPAELDEDRDALADVEHAGRRALAEMRRVLGAMRRDDALELAPQPSLASVEALVEQVGRAGLPVHMSFGRGDWVANGVLFAAYHLHMPWAMPTTLLDTFILAYPSNRYRSAWIGIAVHSAQSVVILALVLALVI
jgi:Type II CAAX prenyl endopeptidase Rce1-like/Histidine kinase